MKFLIVKLTPVFLTAVGMTWFFALYSGYAVFGAKIDYIIAGGLVVFAVIEEFLKE